MVGTILDEFKRMGGDCRILVMPDHATPISVRTHTTDPVPFAICGTDIEPDEALVFTENAARSSAFKFDSGHALVKYLIEL